MDVFAFLLFAVVAAFSPTIVVFILARVYGSPMASGKQTGAVVATFLVNVGALWYWLSQQNFSKGRVLRLRERRRPRYAALARTDGWEAALEGPELDLSALSPVRRAIVTTFWLQSARMEHASIVAFGRLAEALIGLGAPSDLVRRAHEAALDEIRHAEAFFGLVGAAGEPWGAGEMPALFDVVPPARPRSREAAVRSLVRGSLLDGALAEGVASRIAAEVARTTPFPRLAALSSILADDERRHAELGLDVLRFALAVAPDVARDELARARASLVAGGGPSRGLPGGLAEYGLLPPATLDALSAAEVADVARVVDALLEPGTPGAARGAVSDTADPAAKVA